MKNKEIIKILFLLILILSLLPSLYGCTPYRHPLYNAADAGKTYEVKALLDKGEDREVVKSTALVIAVANQHYDVVKLLLDRGVDVNIKPVGGSSPLKAAAKFGGNNKITKLLIEKGADLNTAIADAEGEVVKHPRCTECISGLSLLKSIKAEKEKAKQQPVVIQTATDETPIIKSDIDEVPLIKAKSNRNSYAIVIGIEQYRQKLPKADYAVSDAKLMSEYLTKVMGYPEENVVTLMNERAAMGDFVKYFEKWLLNNVEKDSSVFIYFSGHGAPNPKTGDAYLVPYDGDPSFIDQTGYSLKRMYDALGKLPAKEIIIALDSCFSGAGGRSVLAEGARPLVMNLQGSVVLSKSITVMSAASGDQISSTYKDKGHGLFTYFMLKGIKNEDVVNQNGSIKMDDLFSYLKPQVERIARKQYNNEQTPQLIGAKKN